MGRRSGSFSKQVATKLANMGDHFELARRRGGGRLGIMKMAYVKLEKKHDSHGVDVGVRRLPFCQLDGGNAQ